MELSQRAQVDPATSNISTAFHVMCAELGCRVWLEWVPSKSNPADILSRDHKSEEDILDLFDYDSQEFKTMELPSWVDQGEYTSIDKILNAVRSDCADLAPGE